MPRIIAIDGPPGTGKTRRIVAEATQWTTENGAVVTYTNDAAAVIQKRAPEIPSGTVYSLTWPYARDYLKGAKAGVAYSNRVYTSRKINHLADPALEQYLLDSPSRKAYDHLDMMARQLHAWEGGTPPFDLDNEVPKGALKYALPMARWLEAGAPMPGAVQYDCLMIDEAQDMSWLELRAAIALVKPDGVIHTFGDPGQAIFGESKGVKGAALPPVWQRADETEVLGKGWRVGNPVASVAAATLRPYYDRPASTFAAEHGTALHIWRPDVRPVRGLVLGYSRHTVAKAFREWGLRATGIVPKVGSADKELVLSTGHSAKGAEADDVYLLPWSRVALERLERRDPQTIRLIYVMLTRARKRLHIPRSLKARLPL